MAIDLKISYIQNAHRLSLYDVDDSVTEIRAGQLFQLNDEGRWVYADGTRKAYPTLNDRYAGAGIGLQGERLEGRDNVTRTGKIACLKGNYEIGTDMYDTGATYTHGMPLVPAAGGRVAPYDGAGGGDATLIVGYVTRVPESEDDFLRYEG
jgi:hypothetical protein